MKDERTAQMTPQGSMLSSPTVPWLDSAGRSGRTARRQDVLYVADDHGLGVEIDHRVLDCRSLIAEALSRKSALFAGPGG